MQAHIDRITDALNSRSDSAGDRRTVVALAGAPAAGKSLLAAALAERLGDTAVVFGLDAFHYDDAVLEARGDRDRKGAPHTFDVDGYRAMLLRLRTTPSEPVALPLFDRALELSRSCAVIAEARHQIVITEGNWLLLDDPRWAGLRELFDLTVQVTTDMATIRERIIERWRGHGFDDAEAERRAEENDLPNAQLAIDGSVAADLMIQT